MATPLSSSTVGLPFAEYTHSDPLSVERFQHGLTILEAPRLTNGRWATHNIASTCQPQLRPRGPELQYLCLSI